jgi:hypothetical protein
VGLARRVAPGLVLGAALSVAGFACARGAPAPAPAPCAPVAGDLPAGARAQELAGDFTLSLVATSGPVPGRSTAGRLRLRAFGATPPPVPVTPGARYPLFGGTDVAIAEVGAIAPGDVVRDNPAAPGVLVIEWDRQGPPAGTEITVRLGADANQGDRLRFDGTSMALQVTSIAPRRFAGRWQSSGGELRAGGHFCAERVGT